MTLLTQKDPKAGAARATRLPGRAAAPFVSARPAKAQEGPSASEALAALERHAPAIGERALAAHLCGAFPAEDVALLQEIGVFRRFAEADVAPGELMQALRLIGRANLSLGRIFEGHVNAAKLLRRYGGQGALEGLPPRALLGVWNTEPDPAEPVRIDVDGRLCGRKSFATGAGHLSHALITALNASGERQLVLVEAGDPRRADAAAWRVSGMRGTCSGTYDLTGLAAGGASRIGAPGDYLREPMFSAGAWRFAAVQLGGAERILSLLRGHMTAAAPPGAVAAARFAEALAEVRSAGLWVREAAGRAEAPDAGEDAIAVVLLTRRVVENAALAVMEAAARNVGTRAFFEDHPLDHACRDLALYLRQPAPDQALERAARAFLERDRWDGDALW
jgi:hypothetical protein